MTDGAPQGNRGTLQPAALNLTVPDMAEKEAILLQVCALAMATPRRDPGELQFPPFRTLVTEFD